MFQDMFRTMFDDLQTNFCKGLDLAAADDLGDCWNGTSVGVYRRNLTYFNEVNMLNVLGGLRSEP